MLVVNSAFGQGDLDATQQQLDTITKIVGQIESNLAKNVKNHDVVRKEMAKLDREIGKLHQRIKDSKLKITNSKQRSVMLHEEKVLIDQALGVQANLFQQQIRSAYRARSQSKWKLLLSQSNLQDVGKNALIYDYIHQARVKQINHISGLADEIKTNQFEIKKQQETLQNLLKKQSKEQSGLEKVRIRKENAQRELENKIKSDQVNLKQERSKKKKLQKLLKKLTVKKSQGKFASNAGKLHWPTRGELKNRFGQNRQGSDGLQWSGVSIKADRGDKVHAIYAGNVVFSDWFDHYGWLVIIDHGDEYMSLYAHAEGLYKNVGENVDQGELIAVVGDSGDVDQTSLYFEIRRQGTPVDPANWCVHPNMAYSL
ncbi:MAG: peptidoglycan DD-metalloendopeptidase family protein [Gammaproteobacteria bacterium]|nr:peptidoglycan DD-metalloendopeptidase family protein [Gammaproteobacteria bacterium]